MVLGIGIDLIEKSRIKAIFHEGKWIKFINRILTESEQKKLQNSEKDIDFLAKKWAAKEAISKALGCGIGSKLSFLDIEIDKKESGEPLVKITKTNIETPNFCGKSTDIKIQISISDTKENVVAMCILQK